MNIPTISIITPTKNSEKDIRQLISCLNNQSNKYFYWMVIDGGSTDQTLKIIESECQIKYEIIKAKDFSIYHATNIGVEALSTDYYAVAGSDDKFDLDFIEIFYKHIQAKKVDFIFGAIKANENTIKPGSRLGWLKGMHGVASSHSIGSIIKTDLHEKFGMYSNLFPVVADQYFIKKCINGGASVLKVEEVFGTYCTSGFSSINKLHYQIDFLKMQILTEKNSFLQLFIFILRYVKLRINS